MSKPFNIHDWQAKQKRLTEAEINPDPKERLVQTIVNVFNGRLGNWFPPNEMVRSMSDVQNLFNRDREAITDLVRQHLMDVNVDSGQDTTSGGGVNEMSATGTGASFGAGAGEAFASPNAFKKKRK